MIELVQTPDTNRVIADGNDTLIMVNSTTGAGYYLNAKIYINNQLFLDQAWSKDENGLCTYNLKHLYYAYFENTFSETIETGFHQKSDLYKRVRIEISEYAVGSSNPVDTLILPEFDIIKNHKPEVFNDSETVAFLGLPNTTFWVDKSKGFIFPLYLKAGDLLTARVTDSLGNTLHAETLEDYANQVTQFELNFEDVNLEDHDFIFVKFITAQNEVQRKLRFIKDSLYPPKQIFYLNNFGFYITAFLLGRKEETNALSPESYEQEDGTEVTWDVPDTKELRLNSGHGYKEITYLIHAIATSLDVRLQLSDYWERVKSETKSVPRWVDNQFVYSEELRFTRFNVANFTNENTYALMPQVEDITATGDENEDLEVLKSAFLNAYTATKSATRLRISTLPENGKLLVELEAETLNLSDMVDNNPSLLPYTIAIDDFVKLIFEPELGRDGQPLDVVEFQMGPDVLWSNIGELNLNIDDVPGANLPPNINVNSMHDVAVDANGDGSKQITSTITDPEEDPVSILWEALNGAPITFDDDTLESPTISLSGATPGETYQVKVTATDTANDISSEKTISITASEYNVSIGAFKQQEGEVWDIAITGGEPGGTVTLVHTFQVPGISSVSQYAILNQGEMSESIISGNGTTRTRTETLDANGEKFVQVEMVNEDVETMITLNTEIDSVSGDQIIDDTNNQTSISL